MDAKGAESVEGRKASPAASLTEELHSELRGLPRRWGSRGRPAGPASRTFPFPLPAGVEPLAPLLCPPFPPSNLDPLSALARHLKDVVSSVSRSGSEQKLASEQNPKLSRERICAFFLEPSGNGIGDVFVSSLRSKRQGRFHRAGGCALRLISALLAAKA